VRRVYYVLALIALGGQFSNASSGELPRGDLIEDTRHLARTIENVHPDPYEDDNLDWEWVALGDFRDVLADDIANNEPESSWVWDADPGMW